MKKATRKKLIEWTITVLLAALLVVVAWYRFLGPGSEPRQAMRRFGPEWSELPAVATVEVVREEEEIARGLMGRDSLAPNSGMYFQYDDTDVRTFWMRNTRIPLSIAFIRADGVITSIKQMQPFDETLVSSGVEVKDTLEMNQGWFAENGIEAGDRAELVKSEVHFSTRSR